MVGGTNFFFFFLIIGAKTRYMLKKNVTFIRIQKKCLNLATRLHASSRGHPLAQDMPLQWGRVNNQEFSDQADYDLKLSYYSTPCT